MKTQNMYQTIKQTTRKYALPVLMAGSLALGSCSNNTNYLEVNKQLKINNLESLSKRAGALTDSAKINFNRGVKKGQLTEANMTKIFDYLKAADSLYSHLDSRAKYAHLEKTLDSLNIKSKLSKNDSKLESRLNKALYGVDFGEAELQKDLAKEGYNVEVYNAKTPAENNWGLGFIDIFALGLFVFFVKSSTPRRKIK